MVTARTRLVRRRGLPLALFAPALFAAVLPACLDLPKVDPGPRFVDDFESGDLHPSWTVFDPWTCATFTSSSEPDAGQGDAGDAGDPDGGAVEGPPMKCETDPTGDGDTHALRFHFMLSEPPEGNQSLGAWVFTKTYSGSVDVSGFKQLVFNAYLKSDDPSIPLPSGTQLEVELGCEAIKKDAVASSTVLGQFQANSWAPLPFALPIQQFLSPQGRACLTQVDTIRFTILLPVLAGGASTGGTFHIDNISLVN